MLLSHAVLYAEARSYLGALADGAASFDACLEYERVLLQIDWLHRGEITRITVVPSGERIVLYQVARDALRNLGRHGIDALSIELCLDMLEVAWHLDRA